MSSPPVRACMHVCMHVCVCVCVCVRERVPHADNRTCAYSHMQTKMDSMKYTAVPLNSVPT